MFQQATTSITSQTRNQRKTYAALISYGSGSKGVKAYEWFNQQKKYTTIISPDDKTTIIYCHPSGGVCRRIDRTSVKGTALIV